MARETDRHVSRTEAGQGQGHAHDRVARIVRQRAHLALQLRYAGPLGELVNLRALAIATVPDAALDFLAGCPRLEWLSLLHLPRITDLKPLAGLRHLRFLELQTLPSWDSSGKRTVVDSLEPIVRLPRLEHVSLMGVVGPDRSLAPLECCGSLETAKFHGVLRKESERFFAATGLGTRHMPAPDVSSWPA